jgi:NAD(P)-dependent dehydrogenase (short-subunit alcohol dehydrogenase family)
VKVDQCTLQEFIDVSRYIVIWTITLYEDGPATMNARQLFDLTGRVAIITGGSIGLGRQMAEGLAEMGANLALCARKKERCEEAADQLAALGVKTLALGCDVKDFAAIQQVVASTPQHFGRIDILIINAGVSWGARSKK